MAGADRLSLTFRFEEGARTLDAASQDNLADLVRLMAAGMFRRRGLVFAGFSDGSGDAAANLALSRERADAVLEAVADAAPDLDAARSRCRGRGLWRGAADGLRRKPGRAAAEPAGGVWLRPMGAKSRWSRSDQR